MRLTPKEPDINIGVDGFEEHDQLGRAETGTKLSRLEEQLESPTVIALDGSWGSGKSFFLKCWCGEHKKEVHGKTADVIYFDAFEHDFLDDPLIALAGAISKQLVGDPLEITEGKAKRIKKFKNVAWALGKAGARIGVNVATFGATKHLEELGDAIAEAVGSEASAAVDVLGRSDNAETFWKAENAKMAAMEGFRLALRELTETDKNGDPTKKLVIIIDELDRCRPDYALSMLEVMKHFFAVDGVHFVLGVNMKELENFCEGALWARH